MDKIQNLFSMAKTLEENIVELQKSLKMEDIELENIDVDDELDLSFSVNVRSIEDILTEKYESRKR